MAENFVIQAGFSKVSYDKAFVEQLDSGQVVLLQFNYEFNSGRGTSIKTFYLLRSSSTNTLRVVPYNIFGGGKDFRECILDYLHDRMDLSALVESKGIANYDLPALIYALNSGKPFSSFVN